MQTRKRVFACITAAVTMLSATTALPANAESRFTDRYRMNELSQEITVIKNLQENVLDCYQNQDYSASGTPAVYHALFVKCTDVTMKEENGKQRYQIQPNSDTDKVIDHGIRRFEETVEEMTAHTLDIVPTVIRINEALTVDGAFGYADIKDSLAEPLPVSEYESVFFFSGREGVYSTTGMNVFDGYGESYIQTVSVKDEIARIKSNMPLEEERQQLWTCGNITHEWIHQIDISSKKLLGDDHFPMCHDYQYDSKTDDAKLKQTEEDGAVWLTNPSNGYKWKYEAGKYPDYLGDYYEAFLSGEIIDTKDDNKKKGMFPALWKFICTEQRLGTYTIQNTATGHYLNAEAEPDRYGASVLDAVSDDSPFSAATQWKLIYDPTAWAGGGFRIYSEKNPYELIRAEKGDAVDTAALYHLAWGAEETDVKCFTFTLPRDADGNYQMKTTMDVFKDFVLTETDSGAIECCPAGGNDTWTLTRIDFAEGDYYIRSLPTGDALTRNSTAAVLQPFVTSSTAQTWAVRSAGDNFCTIASSDGKAMLAPKDGKASAGTQVIPVSAVQSSDVQLWQFRRNSDGYDTLVSKVEPTLCLAWDAQKEMLLLQKADDSAAQRWDIGQIPAKSAAGYCYLVGADGTYLGSNGNAVVKSKAPVLWEISEAKDGYYRLRTYTGSSKAVLTVKDAVNQEGTAVQVLADSPSGGTARMDYAQQWAFTANTDGTFRLTPKLTFARGIKVNGTDNPTAVLSCMADSFTCVPVTYSAEDVKTLTAWLCGGGTLKDWQRYDLTGDGILNAIDLTLLKRIVSNPA